MHAAGRMSWQVDVDQSEQLVIGLFVRDAGALHSELALLPPVSPTVTGNGPQEPEEAGAQWDAWNDQNQAVLAASRWTPPASALQAVVAKHFTAAAAWAQARKQEHIDTVLRPDRPPVETTLVADLERTSGRPARPFHLRVTEIQSPGSSSGSCIQTTS